MEKETTAGLSLEQLSPAQVQELVAAGLEHYLNNMLTVLQGEVALAETTADKEQLKEILDLLALKGQKPPPSEPPSSPGEYEKWLQQEAQKWRDFLSQRIQEHFGSQIQPNEDPYHFWQTTVEQKAGEIWPKSQTLRSFQNSLDTLQRSWENLLQLAEKGTLPPLQQAYEGGDFYLDFGAPNNLEVKQ